MRRGITIAMVIFGIWAAISGISQFFPPFDTEFDIGEAWQPLGAWAMCAAYLLLSVVVMKLRKTLE